MDAERTKEEEKTRSLAIAEPSESATNANAPNATRCFFSLFHFTISLTLSENEPTEKWDESAQKD